MDSDIKARTLGVQTQMKKFDFFLACHYVLGHTDLLSEVIYKKTLFMENMLQCCHKTGYLFCSSHSPCCIAATVLPSASWCDFLILLDLEIGSDLDNH